MDSLTGKEVDQSATRHEERRPMTPEDWYVLLDALRDYGARRQQRRAQQGQAGTETPVEADARGHEREQASNRDMT